MTVRPDTPLGAGQHVLAEEAEALRRLASSLGEEFVEAARLLSQPGGVRLVSGLGKSALVGAKIAATLNSIGLPAAPLHAVDALHGDSGMLLAANALIAVSHSGETRELLAVVGLARSCDVPVISITASAKCPLADQATVALATGVTVEADVLGVAPTSSTSATLALGDALAVAAGVLSNRSLEDFRRWHPGGALGRRLESHHQ